MFVMRLESGYITLCHVRFYARHGVMPQEREVGGWFLVTLRVGYPLAQAMQSDEVGDTLNYTALHALLKREMAQPSNLLEHVAQRIATAVEATFPLVDAIDLEITKENPPIGADCDGASVEIHLKK